MPDPVELDEVYDPIAAEACARVLETWDRCSFEDDARLAAPECRRVFTGTRTEGEPCLYAAEECGEGLFCDYTRTLHSCGECMRAPTLGEACAEWMPCAVPAEGDVVCYLDVCEPRGAEHDGPAGVRCGLVRNEADELVIRTCASGTFCVGHASSATCVPRAIVGEACTEGETVCVWGAACIDGPDGLRCRELRFVPRGAPCDETARCNFREHEVCLDGVCTALGDGTAGAFCNSAGSPYVGQCGWGLECDDALEQCVASAPRLADGAPCTDDLECESTFCDRAARICAPPTCF